MRKNGHYGKANDKVYIEISANTNSLKSAIIVKNNYDVHFRRHKSVNSLLGFYSKLYISGFNESENMVKIITINSILVTIDIISDSYVMVPHNLQFTRSFQNSLQGIKFSKIRKIFFTFW